MLHMNLSLIVEVQSIGANVPCATMIAGEGGVAVTAGEEIAAVAVLLALAGDVDIHRPED